LLSDGSPRADVRRSVRLTYDEANPAMPEAKERRSKAHRESVQFCTLSVNSAASAPRI